MRQNMSTDRKKHSLIAPLGKAPELVITCPRCGSEIDLWSEDDETTCMFCDYKLFDRETTTH